MKKNLKRLEQTLKFDQRIQGGKLLNLKGGSGAGPMDPGCHGAVSHVCGTPNTGTGGGGTIGNFIP